MSEQPGRPLTMAERVMIATRDYLARSRGQVMTTEPKETKTIDDELLFGDPHGRDDGATDGQR